MDGATTALLITSIGALVKLFWSDWQADKRAVREREWAMQDRQQVANNLAKMVDTKASEVAEHLAVKVDAKAAELATVTQQTSSDIQQAIAENTALTLHAGDRADVAFKEANTANEKIAAIGLQLVGKTK